jgi:glycosyltransferase involved in cell wall biosynthesis
MIPAYNCAVYLRETLASVLAQDPGPHQMQIEVVDDCSSDDPEAVVDELGAGRVSYYRQVHNVGHVRNFNTCIERSRGHLVHLLHGDDTVRDRFYQTMQQPFHDHPEIGAAFCRHVYIDEGGGEIAVARLHQSSPGVFADAGFRMVADVGIQPPAVVVRRSTYERLGGFHSEFTRVLEDLEMWVRIAAHYPVWYEPEPLACYRKRPGSLVSGSAASGAVMKEYRARLDLVLEHLDEGRREPAKRAARRRGAGWALAEARLLAAAGDRGGTLTQLWEAFLCEPSTRVAVRAPKIFARALVSRRRRGADTA